MTCAKNGGQAPVCSACLEGYFTNDNGVMCTKCADNCATCSEANNANKCSTCMAGFFLVGTKGEGQCVSCGDTAQGGIDGCAECSGTTGSLKCTKCKPNRRSKGDSGNYICEEKTCEDETVCGGTAGACDAIVISASGEMTYYCSLCGDSTKIPIDGKCVDKTSSANGNTCKDGVCTSCTANYFLYMGGCYSVSKEPGSLMCTAAAGGICTAAANSRYFLVPGAKASQQSVLGCGNPLGTTVGGNAYVGVEGCRTCEAPAEASNGAMAAAKCTACDGSKKPTGSGYGCVTCGDGHRLESDTCVRTGGNLSTGAIAGISVAVIVVVGGLLGFLCWWFLCRGKA